PESTAWQYLCGARTSGSQRARHILAWQSDARTRREGQEVLRGYNEGASRGTSSPTGTDDLMARLASRSRSREMTLSTSAIRVMKRFGVDEALIGDLHEQVERSTLWLWRQAAGAILVAIFVDFRVHWILAARAIVVGMLLWTVALPLAFGLW